MTRNTRLYNAKIPGKEIIFRTLNVTEIDIINKVNNMAYKQELAFDIAVTKGSTDDFMIKSAVGKQIIEQSLNLLSDEELFEITVQASREYVQNDMVLNMIRYIIGTINISVDYLMTCTVEDLIEFVAMSELINNKRFFKTGDIKQKTINNRTDTVDGKHFIPEENTMSLAEKMKQAQKELR